MKMRKTIIAFILTVSLLLSGCGISKSDEFSNSDSQFKKLTNDVCYDVDTKICYYINKTYSGFAVKTPFYGTDKQLITKDEFVSKYNK